MTIYTGNQTTLGYDKVYVFDRTSGTGATQANFLTTMLLPSNAAGTTTQYVALGGATHGTTQEMSQYIGNEAYKSYARTMTRTFTTIDETTGGITTTVQQFTPDPRIQFSFYGIGGFTGVTGFTANHMDHIHVPASNGTTYEGFIGRIVYNQDDPGVAEQGNVFLVEVLAYGRSGSDAGAEAYNLGAGMTFFNVINGNTGTVVNPNRAYKNIDLTTYKDKIMGQAGRRLSETDFIGATIGDAGASQSVFYNVNDPRLINFVSTLLPAFAQGGSGANGLRTRSVDGIGGDSLVKQGKIFTMLAGVTGNLGAVSTSGREAVFGVTFNAATGGTGDVNRSAFEEFAHHVLHNHAKNENTKGQVTYTIINKKNLNDIDQINL